MLASADDVLSMVMFARVVEARSFTAAAGKLGVSKSVVSARISALEHKLGTRLLQRTTRSLSLTQDGLALYERCARITAEADQAAALASGSAQTARGVLRVNAPVVFAQSYLTAPINQYLAEHPDVRVDLVLSDRLVDLVDDGIDVAVRVSSRLSDSSLVGRKLAIDRTVVCASPGYLERRGVPATPAELVHHDCLRYSVVRVQDEWRFRSGKSSFSVPVEGRFSAASGAVLREAALADMGIAVLPSFMVAAELASGRLVSLLEPFTYIRLAVHAIYPAGRVVPAKVRSFVDLLAAHFRAPPWKRI